MPVAVIDACVAVAYVMLDEQDSASQLIGAHEERRLGLIAPTVWEYEVANSLRTATLRGRIQASFARELLAMLLGMGIRFTGFSDLVTRAWELALTRGLTVYDASYIALAEARDCDLYTCDAQLARAAEDLVTVHLLRGA